MTRRRGASHKKPRRPRPRSTVAVDGDDDRDIDYVAGEEDEQSASGTDGEDASTSGSTGEESFQFNGSGETSDEEVAATKPKRKVIAKVTNRDGESAGGSRRRSRNLDFIVDVGDDDGDEDFAPEDELEIVSPIAGKKRKSKASSTGRKRRKPTGVAAAKKRCRKPSASDDDEDFELDGEADKKSIKTSGKRTVPPRRAKEISGSMCFDFVCSDDDEDFELEGQEDKKSRSTSVKRTAPRRAKKKSGSANFNFVGSDDDEDFELKGKVDKKRKMTSGKRTAPPRSAKKKSGSADSDFVVSDGDEDFELEDEVDKKSKRSSGKRTAPRRANKRSGLVDSDFVASDDDFIWESENRIMATRKKRTAAVKARKRSVRIDVTESSDSSDSDYVVSEEEVGDLDDRGVAGKAKAKIGLKSKGVEKGKEKEDHVAEKGNCSICLCDEQKGTIRGVLDCCVHFFCYACIIMWSKMDTHCPYCKQRFRTITQSGLGLRKPITVRVKERDQVYQPSEEELREWMDHYENAVCIICSQGGDDDLMLLCDICDSPAHTYCTGLGREVPEGNWYCDVCRSPRQGSPNPPVQEAAIDQRPSSNDLLCGDVGTEDLSTIDATTDIHKSPSFPGQSSAQSIDLNVSPAHISDEDHGTHQSGDILPGSPNLHAQDTAVDQGTSSSNLSGVTSSSNLSGVIRTVDLRTNMLTGKVVSLPGRFSSRKTVTLSGSSNSRVLDKGTSSSNLSGVIRTEGLHINTNARKSLFLSGQSSLQRGGSPIGPSNLQVQDNMVDQGIDSSNFSGVVNEDLRRIMNAGKAVSFPEQSPSQSGHILSGSSNLQVQDTAVNKGSNSDFLTNMHATKGALTGLSCSQRIDLNLSPGHILGEDHGVSTQSSGAVASTISGRRHIHKRICILLSNNRSMQTNGTTESSRRCVERDVMIPEAEQGLDQQNCRPVSQSTTSLDPRILSEESSIRRVDRAKEQVLLMVKNHLKEIVLAEEREAFKEIARRSTHTILAACGMKHRGRLVAAVVHPPENCSHDSSNELINLVEGCCLSCFNSFVSDVVRKVMDSIKMAKENAAASSASLLGTK